MPSTFLLRHTNPNTSSVIQYYWDSEKSWYHEDTDVEEDNLPEIIIQPTLEGHLRTNDQPINDIIRTTENQDPAVAYNKLDGKRLYDEWSVSVVDDGAFPVEDSNGDSAGAVTARDRVEACTFNLKDYFWFEAREDLYNYGSTGYEIPVRCRILTGGGDTSSLVDQSNYARRQFTVRFLYTLTYKTAVDAVDRIRGSVDVDGTFDVDV